MGRHNGTAARTPSWSGGVDPSLPRPGDPGAEAERPEEIPQCLMRLL